jgi:hypothetical protein
VTFTRGNRVIDDHVAGEIARGARRDPGRDLRARVDREMEDGECNLDKLRAEGREAQIEQVGLELPVADDARAACREPSVG